MRFPIRSSHLIAVLITAGIAGWMATGHVVVSGQADAATDADSAQSPNNGVKPLSTEAAKKVAVRIQKLSSKERTEQLEIRGRTEANATISVRAETGGILLNRHVDEGARVKSGDLLCSLDKGTREAKLLKRKAALETAQIDHEASKKLRKKGYSAKNRVMSLQANLDAAKADLADAELDLARTEIRAPNDGIVVAPLAETGEMISVGGLCATVIAVDPMLVVGQVSERDIGRIRIGMAAAARLVTGETVEGQITYIAPSADTKTRTFKVEIEVPNSGGTIREGVTARAAVRLNPSKGHFISPAILVLDDDGRMGVRIVDANDIVEFMPVKIIADANDGIWITGLPETVRVITVGQDYVVSGQAVTPVIESAGAQ